MCEGLKWDQELAVFQELKEDHQAAIALQWWRGGWADVGKEGKSQTTQIMWSISEPLTRPVLSLTCSPLSAIWVAELRVLAWKQESTSKAVEIVETHDDEGPKWWRWREAIRNLFWALEFIGSVDRLDINGFFEDAAMFLVWDLEEMDQFTMIARGPGWGRDKY